MAKVNHQDGGGYPGKHGSGQANELLSALPHALSMEQFMSEVCTHQELGLAASEAAFRLEKFGPNGIDKGEGVSVTKILVRQIANAMILVIPTTSPLKTHRSSDPGVTGPDYSHGG